MSSPLASNFELVVLDCDGVLWLSGKPIPGSVEAVQALQEAGRGPVFVTNSSVKSRAAVASRVSELMGGVVIAADDVVTSSSVAAAELAARGACIAFVVGGHGLREELRAAGVELFEPVLPEPFDEAAFRSLAAAMPEQVGAVVIGHDEAFSYSKLAMASLVLQQNEGCLFIGTNPDVGNRDEAGYLVPEAGALIAAVEAASGRKAQVVGKPAPAPLLQLLDKRGLRESPGAVLMVGDRLDTDVQFGAAAGVQTCLVLTGVSRESEVACVPGERRPDHVKQDLAEVVSGFPAC